MKNKTNEATAPRESIDNTVTIQTVSPVLDWHRQQDERRFHKQAVMEARALTRLTKMWDSFWMALGKDAAKLANEEWMECHWGSLEIDLDDCVGRSVTCYFDNHPFYDESMRPAHWKELRHYIAELGVVELNFSNFGCANFEDASAEPYTLAIILDTDEFDLVEQIAERHAQIRIDSFRDSDTNGAEVAG